MKSLIFIAALLAAGVTLAEEEVQIRVNRMETAVAAPQETEEDAKETDEASATKAQDYNSSRSNTTTAAGPAEDLNNEDSDSDSDMQMEKATR